MTPRGPGRADASARSSIHEGQRAGVAIVVKVLAVLCVGTLLGLAVTFLVLESRTGFGAMEAGPWVSWPQDGLGTLDPYSRARLARTHELPLGASEGLSLVATGDDKNSRFDPSCDYIVTGDVPRARYWTLTLLSSEGFPIANAAERYGFTSTEILRAADGTFQIVLSQRARAGNWLPVGKTDTFVLFLRLYDTELHAGTDVIEAKDLPRILEGPCG